MVKNGTVIYVSQPKHLIVPSENVKYTEQEIDLEKVPLNGGVLVKTLSVSADPFMRYRMRDTSIPMFCPAMIPGQVYVRHTHVDDWIIDQHTTELTASV